VHFLSRQEDILVKRHPTYQNVNICFRAKELQVRIRLSGPMDPTLGCLELLYGYTWIMFAFQIVNP
jgi:hypothetical protein